MAATALLLDLLKSCQEKTNEGIKSFEADHFTWLEEAVVAARQTFAHKDPVLLPMTPAAKKLTKKRPINRTAKDEGDSDDVPCPPAKRSLVEAAEEKPRRGRAASKAAQLKIKSGIAHENFKGKMRRPDPEETMNNVTVTKEQEEIMPEQISSPHSQNSYTPQTKYCSSSSNEESTTVKTPVREEIPEVTPLPTPSPVTCPKDQGSPRKKSIKYGKRDVSFMDSIRESDDSQEEDIEKEEKTDFRKTEICMVTEDSSEVETEGVETDSMDEPLEMSPLQLNETEVISRLNETEVISKLNETEVISKLNETEVICKLNETDVIFKLDETEVVCKLDETEVIDKNDGESKLNETVVINKHNETGIGNKLNETEVIKLTLTSDEDSNKTENTTESETENVIKNDKMSESDENMPPPPIVEEAPKSRSTRTKTRGKKSEPRAIEPATSEDEVSIPVEAPKSRSSQSRGKKSESRKIEIATSEDDHVQVPKPRSTRTKKKNAGEILQANTEVTAAPSPKPRSTRTKKRQLDEEKTQAEKPARSTRTKRKKEEEEKAVEPQEESGFSLALSESEDEGVGESLDGKEMAVNSTYVKDHNNHNHSMESVSSEVSCKSEASNSKEVVVAQPPRRVTRSKVRPAPPVRDLSPKKTESNQSPRNLRTSRTPVKQNLTKTPNKQYSPRPFASKTGSVKKMAEAYQSYVTESDEVENEGAQNTQSPRATRHSKGTSKASTKRESYAQRCARKSLGRAKSLALAAGARTSSVDQDLKDHQKSRKKVSKINPETKTPTKTPDYPSEKVVRPRPVPMSGRVTPSQSGRITPKTFSRVKPIVSAYSSTSENRTKKVFTPSEMKRTKSVLGTTPNEMKRTKNIISGVSSFIKTQPSKPTKDEIEEKKKEELRKKKERGEEGKRKRDELIAKKMEEQKKRNEERMRKVQEARAERERKVIEAKQQQDNDKKIREERQKDDQLRKKQQAQAKKKAEEELRLQRIREQHEEEERRRKEEERRKISEDNRLAEEARKAEAERKARIAEQRRILEEKQKRAAEAERIARERQELERLRQREAERLALAQKTQNLNDTYNTQENKENSTNHNSTYSVQASTSSTTVKKERNDSYEMTPDRKPAPKKKTVDPNCYYIGDIASEDSTDDETQPKKKIPAWAQGTNLKAALVNQEYFPPEVNSIFPPALLLQMPDLSEMFPIQRRRFHKRGSSAIWNTPPSKLWAS